MRVERHTVVGLLGAALGVLAVVLTRTSALAGATRVAAILLTTLLGGLGLGYGQYVGDSRSADEKRPFFDSRIAYIAWWTVFYGLFFHVASSIPVGDPTGGTGISVLPWWLVVGTFALIFAVTIALGGVDRRARPSYWREKYIEGKALATGEE